ncbi:GMC oxidoreductase [Sorangium sp. So ce117]
MTILARLRVFGRVAEPVSRAGDGAAGQPQSSVLTSDLRVDGARGLRVVDAPVFPRIPGFFILSAVFMIAKKAADVILADARG